MRPVPAAPADVVADAILGDPAQRVVERAHAQVGPAPVVVPGLAAGHHRVGLVHHHRVVDLEQQAGVDDRLVLLVERVGEREYELLLGGVVLVLEPVRARGRDHREEPLDAVVLGQGRLEVRDVAVERGAVVVERAGAHPRHRCRPRVVVGVGARGGGVALAHGRLVERVERGVRARERLAVAARGQHARALERYGTDLEAADPLVQVRDPAGLAHLAVVDDVDPGLDLLAYDVEDRVSQALLVCVLVDALTPLLGREKRQQLRRPDQAPGVGRKDSVHVHSSSPAWLVTCEVGAMLWGPRRSPGTGRSRQCAQKQGRARLCAERQVAVRVRNATAGSPNANGALTERARRR